MIILNIKLLVIYRLQSLQTTCSRISIILFLLLLKYINVTITITILLLLSITILLLLHTDCRDQYNDRDVQFA